MWPDRPIATVNASRTAEIHPFRIIVESIASTSPSLLALPDAWFRGLS
jgi:hypothetical protein